MTGPPHQDNVVSFPGETSVEVEAAAARWLSVLTSGDCSMADLVAFEIWKSDSPDHERVYRELDAMWQALGAVRREALPPPRQTRRWWGAADDGRVLKYGALAASVAALLFGTQIGVQYMKVWRYDYHTRPGQIQTVQLPDGSVVSLKGDTAINVHLTSRGARRVELARGEAFFDVKHDAARPFVVQSGGATVQDLGTGFSVGRRGDAGSVDVERGSVRVMAAGRSEDLVAGEGVTFDPYELSRSVHIDPEDVSPWRRGLYFAKDEPLSQVTDDLDEYYPGKILVFGPKLRAQPINAVVQLSHVDAWLDALGKVKGVSVRRLGSLVIVSARPT